MTRDDRRSETRVSKMRPREAPIGTFDPSSDCTATAPMQTMTPGLRWASSASSHGRHALTSLARGFLWMRRLPRSPLAARRRLPAEMLDGIREVEAVAIEPGRLDGAIEHGARRSDKGVSLAIFDVAGLFADQHDRGARRSLAKDGLRRAGVQRTRLAGPGGAARAAERPQSSGAGSVGADCGWRRSHRSRIADRSPAEKLSRRLR